MQAFTKDELAIIATLANRKLATLTSYQYELMVKLRLLIAKAQNYVTEEPDMARNRTLIIDGHNINRTHVIHSEVDGAREANQVLKDYIEKYPDYTFTMRPKAD